jgi:hypothetical protein
MDKSVENGREQRSYPVIPVKHWWALRKQFRKSIPASVTPNYISSVLGMTEESARSNVIPSLKAVGIVEDDGKPTQRAVRWRDDDQYTKVCKEIREEVYPKGLLDIGADGTAERMHIERWFANHTGHGEAAVRRMAAIYHVLCEADPAKQKEAESGESTRHVKRAVAQKRRDRNKVNATHDEPQDPGNEEHESVKPRRDRGGPALHLNVQIHISPDATPEQIEQIFASMARHLKHFSE